LPPARTAEASYVRARAASALGSLGEAATGFSAALAASPGDKALAQRAFRQAMLAGDKPLAVRAATTLEQANELPADGTLLMFSESVAARDWKGASLRLATIEKQEAFRFLLPVLRAWVAFGAKTGEPMTSLETGQPSPLAVSYIAEHRALLLLAQGRVEDGMAALAPLVSAGDGRSARLRIAAAARLAELGERKQAATLLEGEDAPIVAARDLLSARKPIPGAITTPADGIAELLVRLGADINRERVSPVALSLARLSTFLAPGNSETWLVTASMLASADHPSEAVAAVNQVAANDPFATTARDTRVQLLVRKGEQEAALAEALAAAKRRDRSVSDIARVGDIYNELGRNLEAAEAYGEAIDASAKGEAPGQSLWSLHLLRGSAFDQAGRWDEAVADLRKAVELAPQEPVALNYLGYAQLERRINLDEAEKLIEAASRLKPDDPSITDSLGWVYYLRGDKARAIDTLERAVTGEPGEPTINEHLGDAYWSVGRKLEARFAWRAALVGAEAEDATRINRKIDMGLTPEVAAP